MAFHRCVRETHQNHVPTKLKVHPVLFSDGLPCLCWVRLHQLHRHFHQTSQDHWCGKKRDKSYMINVSIWYMMNCNAKFLIWVKMIFVLQVRVNTLRQMTRCAASPAVHLPTLFDEDEVDHHLVCCPCCCFSTFPLTTFFWERWGEQACDLLIFRNRLTPFESLHFPSLVNQVYNFYPQNLVKALVFISQLTEDAAQ